MKKYLIIGSLALAFLFVQSPKLAFADVTLPTVSTISVTSITDGDAIAAGSIDSTGGDVVTARGFDFTGGPGVLTETGSFDVGNFTSPSSLFICGSHLTVRAFAINSIGTAYGNPITFDTLPCPTVSTVSVTGVTSTGATLNGQLDSMGGATSVGIGFLYIDDDHYLPDFNGGGFWAYATPSEMTATGSYASTLTSLDCNTLYHFRAATPGYLPGWAYVFGSEMTFTTLPCPVIPDVETLPSGPIGEHSAWLNAALGDFGGSEDIDISFDIGLDTSYGTSTSVSTVSYIMHGSLPVYVSIFVNSLDCETEYHFRAVATNSAGSAYGDDMTFTTLPCSDGIPVVVTDVATGTSQTSAVLAGFIESGENIFDIGFQIGQETGDYITYNNGPHDGYYNLGLYTIGTGGVLSCNTIYHYRFFAINSIGIGYGDDRTFTTEACSNLEPSVITGPASSVSIHNATLNGIFIEGSDGAEYVGSFEYGTTESYGTSLTFPIGHSSGATFSSITGYNLYCNTTYHYRAIVTDGTSTWYGNDMAFTTSECLVLTTNPASDITQTSAIVSATQENLDLPSYQVGFEYGQTTSYGSKTPLSVINIPSTITQLLSGLTCGTTYHYKPQSAFTETSTPYVPNFTTVFGADMTFTTLPCSSGGGGGGGGGIPPPPACDLGKVDANNDCKVDILDFVILMAHWDETGSNNIGDFNNDLKVEILDFVLLMAKWTH